MAITTDVEPDSRSAGPFAVAAAIPFRVPGISGNDGRTIVNLPLGAGCSATTMTGVDPLLDQAFAVMAFLSNRVFPNRITLSSTSLWNAYDNPMRKGVISNKQYIRP